ncbi:hypothetical protein [Paenibacillus taiwanensis]|uniref:hypothetical protein n=1 Tax=Paenibacillus taiwanensis TaxID=401638 RepID=UPI000420E033|nr:hypothetical protein [Paenibacillus taiwanensis]
MIQTTNKKTVPTVPTAPKPKPPAPSPYGNGGADYNNSDTEMKRRLAQSQMKIASNPNYVQSETARALDVIKNRQFQGMDTSAQQKYLTQNLGYKAPQVQSPSQNTTMVQPTTAAQPKSYSDEAKQLFEGMKNRVNQPNKEFSYAIETDPAYQAALQRAKANIDVGNSQAQAEMNRRGILNSTITSDRMGEIASGEMGRVETEVVPQLMQQAYQRYLDQQNQDQQQFANMGSLAGMYTNEDQRGFDNRVTEAGLTGNWVSPEASDAINNILRLKQQAETKGITAQERELLSNQANGYRAKLLALGVDPSQYAAVVNYNTASQNNPGLRTLQGQQLDVQRQQANNDAAMGWSQLSGQILTPQKDYSGYQRQIERGNNPLTLQGQQQQSDVGQRAIDNAWTSSQSLGYVTSELSQLTGIPEGTPTIQARQAMENIALDQAQFQRQLDNDSYGQMMDQYQMNNKGQGKMATADNYYNVIKGMIQRDEDGNLLNHQSIDDFIIMSGLPENEMKKLYTYAGLPIPKN